MDVIQFVVFNIHDVFRVPNRSKVTSVNKQKREKCHHVVALLIWEERNVSRIDVECGKGRQHPEQRRFKPRECLR